MATAIGQFFGYRNSVESDTVCGWGVKVPANEVCTGDPVRVVTKSGNVYRVTASKRTHKPFIDKISGELVEVFAIRKDESDEIQEQVGA